MGAGAVGTYYGGMLALAGVPVTMIGRAHHVDAFARDGLAIERADRRDVARVRASTEPSGVRDADVVLVCVKSKDTRDAALAMQPHLRRDAVLVSLQNGVSNPETLAEVLDQVVLGAVVWVGTSMARDGVVRHSGGGDLALGVARASATRPGAQARAHDVAAMFEGAGVRCPVAGDVDAALWRKLVVNCAFNAVSALGRSRYARMVGDPSVRELMAAAATEAVAVARAGGIALDLDETIASLWTTAAKLAQQHSSTAQDIVRGKPTEIDALNGEVVRRGRALGVPTPVNHALHALVRLREGGDDLA
jgi:2-dehydropantoate 2-reductase